MADRYWVGGTATWDATAGTKWATTSGGAGGAAVPTSADDVYFDGNSGTGTVTVNSTVSMRSITCTGFTGTLDCGGSALWSIGDASGGALTLSSGMTLTTTTGFQINLISTSNNGGAGWGVTSAGKQLRTISISGGGGKWVLQDGLNIGGHSITFSAGAGAVLDTNNQSVAAGAFNCNTANSRTLTLGSSAITLSGAWTFTTTTNLTMTANTAVVTQTGAASSFAAGAGFNWNGMSLIQSGSGTSTLSPGTFANYTRTGTAAKTDIVSISGAVTCSGTFTANGNSDTNRVLVQSNTLGTLRTVTAASVSCSNVDFMDITGAGAANWDLSAITGGSGDAGGNSGIIFTPSLTLYKTNNATLWDQSTWSLTSGGTSNQRVPLAQDDVILDSNSANATINMPRACRDLACTTFTGTLTFSTSYAIYGSYTLGAAMTVVTGGLTLTLRGRGSHTMTHNGVLIPGGGTAVVIAGPGGTYAAQGALLFGATIVVDAGTFDTNDQNVRTWALTSNTTTVARTLLLGNSVFTFTATSSTPFSVVATNLTVTAATTTFVIDSVSTSTRTFAGAGFNFGTLSYAVANSPGILLISGSNTFNTINIGNARSLQLTAGTTQTVTNWNVNGINRDYVYLPGVSGSYISTPDTAANSITGDITIDLKIALTDWTPSSIQMLLSKMGSSSTRSYRFEINTGGTIAFTGSLDGSTTTAAVSTVSTSTSGVIDGGTLWVRVCRASSTGICRFYTSSDGSAWTKLGADVATTAGSLFDSTSIVELMGTFGGTSSMAIGKIFVAKLYASDLGSGSGTPVQSFDAAAQITGQDTYTSPTGEVWTLNGLAKQGDGRVTLESSTAATHTLSKSSGIVTSDYLTIRDSTATGGATWYAGNHSIDISNNSGWIFGSTNFEGWGDPL